MYFRAALMACWAVFAFCGPATAEPNYPTRPVKIVVPYPAGGSSDAIARIIAQQLGERLGQSFVVENHGGAGGTMGTAAVAQSQPDGYTLALVVDAHAINPSVFPNLPFDAVKDFRPLAFIGRAPLILLVPKTSPFNSAADIVQAARAKPASINLGTLGRGSQPELAGYLFAQKAGVTFVEVPYAGGGAVVKDIVSGAIQATFITQGSVASLVRAGDLKGLGVTSPRRTALFPDVPTMKELGYDFTSEYWFGLLAPANIPEPIAQKLETEILSILSLPEFNQRVAAFGVVVEPMAGRAFADYIKSEREKWAKVMADKGAGNRR